MVRTRAFASQLICLLDLPKAALLSSSTVPVTAIVAGFSLLFYIVSFIAPAVANLCAGVGLLCMNACYCSSTIDSESCYLAGCKLSEARHACVFASDLPKV